MSIDLGKNTKKALTEEEKEAKFTEANEEYEAAK